MQVSEKVPYYMVIALLLATIVMLVNMKPPVRYVEVEAECPPISCDCDQFEINSSDLAICQQVNQEIVDDFVGMVEQVSEYEEHIQMLNDRNTQCQFKLNEMSDLQTDTFKELMIEKDK